MKPLFNEKGSGVINEVVLLEKDKILKDEIEVAKEFHSFQHFQFPRDHRELTCNSENYIFFGAN